MAEEIIFKVGVNTGSTVADLTKIQKEMTELDESTDVANQGMKTLNKTFEDVYGDLQPLTGRMGELEDRMYELALAGKQNTEEFQMLQNEVVKYKQTILETDKAVDLLTEQGKGLGTALQIGSAVTAGYGAVQGSMALLGSESEDLEKAMVKLQAIQAVLNSLEQIKITLDQKAVILSSVKAGWTKALTIGETIYAAAIGTTTGAMTALRVAMLAIPIVAIIAGIAALVAVISSLSAAEETAEERNNKLTESYERQQEAFDRAMASRKRETQNQIDLAKARGASESEVFQMEREQILENEAIRKKSIRAEEIMIRLRKDAYARALLEGNDDLAKSIREEIAQHRTKFKDLKAMDGQYKTDLELQRLEFQKQEKEKQDEADKQASDKAKANAEAAKRRREEEQKKRLEQERMYEDLVIANIEDANQRAVAELALKHKRERDEIISKYGKNSKLIQELEKKQTEETLTLLEEQDKAYEEQQKQTEQQAIEAQNKLAEQKKVSDKAELEARLLQIEEDFNAEQELKKELAALERDQAKEDKTLTTGELFKIDEEYNAKIRELDKETAERNKQLKQEEIDRAVEWTEKSVEALQNLGDAYFANRLAKVEKGSKAEEDLARKQFKFNKALQLGGAIMDAGKAVMASLASSPIAIGPVPNPAGIASLAFVAAQSAASISKILATKFEGSTSGGGSVSPPSISSGGSVSAPIPNNDGNSTLTAGLNGAQKATKVFVVESEISMKQESSKKVDSLTTFGG